MDRGRAEQAIRTLLAALGEDPGREGLRRTPERVAAMYAELLRGIQVDPRTVLETQFIEETYTEPILARNITFYSLCEHHLLPFFGAAHVAYLPAGRIVGASKLLRLVDVLSHRLQLQERLTSQIADTLHQVLQPRAVAVMMEAEHLCMSMRGVHVPGTRFQTTAFRGLWQDDPVRRAEFFAMVRSS